MNEFNHYQIQADNPQIHPQLRPEWLRIPDAIKLFGLSRSKLYELIANRRIKSFCLRERGKIKGVRLISYDSLCQFLEAQAAQEVRVQ